MSAAATIVNEGALLEPEQGSEVVLVEHLTVVAEDADRFAESWAAKVAALRREPGFVSAQLRPVAAGDRGEHVSIVVWRAGHPLPVGFGPADRGAAAVRRFGAVEVDSAAREVRKGGAPVRLTLKEYELLSTLMSQPGRVFRREELMDRVWGYRAALETGTLSVHMRRLRAKLEEDPADPRHLQTVWGVGYRFVA